MIPLFVILGIVGVASLMNRAAKPKASDVSNGSQSTGLRRVVIPQERNILNAPAIGLRTVWRENPVIGAPTPQPQMGSTVAEMVRPQVIGLTDSNAQLERVTRGTDVKDFAVQRMPPNFDGGPVSVDGYSSPTPNFDGGPISIDSPPPPRFDGGPVSDLLNADVTTHLGISADIVQAGRPDTVLDSRFASIDQFEQL